MRRTRKEIDKHAQRRSKGKKTSLGQRIRRLLGLGKPQPGIPRSSRFGTYFIIGILAVIGLLVYAVGAYNNELRQGHIGLARHWHAKLRIVINGKEYPIPASIGVKAVRHVVRGRRGSGLVTDLESEPLHTHADDGVIHIESKTLREYTLGEFFKAWGKAFDSNCILDYCNNAAHAVKMFVDGKENPEFERLILRDGQNIVISYEGGSSRLYP